MLKNAVQDCKRQMTSSTGVSVQKRRNHHCGAESVKATNNENVDVI